MQTQPSFPSNSPWFCPGSSRCVNCAVVLTDSAGETASRRLHSSHHILAHLTQGYKHEAAEVRKAVVFALVEVYLVLGDDLQPHLEPLSPSQLKLLKIYVKRSQDRLGASHV